MIRNYRRMTALAITGVLTAANLIPVAAETGFVNSGPGVALETEESETTAAESTDSGSEAESAGEETEPETEPEKPAGPRAQAADGQEFIVADVARTVNMTESHKTSEDTYEAEGNTFKKLSFPGIDLTLNMGQGKQITDFRLNLNGLEGEVAYDACVNNGGWQPWTFSGNPTGGTEDSTYLEGIRIMPRHVLEKSYDIYYAVTMSGLGKLGYAKNGEMAGAPGRGEYVTDIDIVIVPKGEMAPGSTQNAYWAPFEDNFYNEDGMIKYKDTEHQGWLESGDYRYFVQDGQVLTGWQYIEGYKYYFAENGRLVQDVDEIIGRQSSYYIKINKLMNCLTIYAPDGANGYIIPVKSMLTSVGDDTPEGTFKTPEKYRWRQMVTGAYAQYATRIKPNAGFLLHSVIFDVPNNATLWTDTFNALGVARSLGCVRLTTGNAKWVYDHCAVGTSITVYNDPVAGPFQKPGTVPIPANQNWDPTDPDS